MSNDRVLIVTFDGNNRNQLALALTKQEVYDIKILRVLDGIKNQNTEMQLSISKESGPGNVKTHRHCLLILYHSEKGS